MKQMRANIYIDGFNLYHGICDTRRKNMLWLNLESLSKAYLKSTETLHCIDYFTTLPSRPLDKVKRHEKWLKAIAEFHSIQVHFGKFNFPQIMCPLCRRAFVRPTEKITDVNIAVRLVIDGFKNNFEVAYILSADADLVPAINAIKQHFPEKKIKAIFPPNRKNTAISDICDYVVYLNEKRLSAHLLPDPLILKDGSSLSKPIEWN
jgi:uncharacterized LabA/DUF88 family protein